MQSRINVPMSDTEEVHGECCLGYHLNILHIFIKFKKILWESITITFGNLTHSLPELQQSGAPCVCVRVQRESSQCAQQERAISKSSAYMQLRSKSSSYLLKQSSLWHHRL